MKAIPGIALCVKVGSPGQEMFLQKADYNSHTRDYFLPPYHQQINEPPKDLGKLDVTGLSDRSDIKDKSYKNTGVIVKLNYAVMKRVAEKLRARVTCYKLVPNVSKGPQPQPIKDTSGNKCSAVIPTVSKDSFIPVKPGMWVKFDQIND